MTSSEQREPAAERVLTLVKLGGSLITDKTAVEVARPEVIRRLADELARSPAVHAGRVIVGHGGGSFGHTAAARAGLHRGPLAGPAMAGVSETQAAMRRLTALVVAALRDAGAAPVALAPSSFLVGRAGAVEALWPEAILAALGAGLLPVVSGDVMVDRAWGAAICSTESLFVALAQRLAAAGLPVARVLWLGETAGVLDPDGTLIERIAPSRVPELVRAAGAARGTDVTGGMRHRLEAAAALAARGVTSWIADGRIPGLLERALAGEQPRGTVVVA